MKRGPLCDYKMGASLVLAVMGASAWALTHVVSLNPDITDLNRIRVGQKLTLVSEQMPSLASTETLDATGERSPAQATDAQGTEPAATHAEFSRFDLSAKFLQSRLAATDSSTGGKSIMGSGFSPELSARWGQDWESGFQSFLQVHLRRESFKTTSSTQTLSENTPLLYGFSLGARLLPVGETGALEASIQLDQESFIRAKIVTEITVDSVLVPKARLLLRTSLMRSRIFRIGSELSASYLAPMSMASYSTKSGYDIGTGLSLALALMWLART